MEKGGEKSSGMPVAGVWTAVKTSVPVESKQPGGRVVGVKAPPSSLFTPLLYVLGLDAALSKDKLSNGKPYRCL